MHLRSIAILVAIFFGCACNGQRDRAMAQLTPWNNLGGKLYIITDPDSGESTYAPASLFFQRIVYGKNPFICNLLSRRCWPSADEEKVEEKVTPTTESENSVDGSSTSKPSTGGRGTIYGHPTFHQGSFSDPTTKRPFNAWTGTAGSASAASARSGTGLETTSTGSGTGQVRTGTIFGHPHFHQGEFPEETGTQRPFQPWAGSSASSSSISTTNGGQPVMHTSSMKSGREKRAAYGSSASSRSYSSSSSKGGDGGGWEQSHYAGHGSDYPAPVVPNLDQFAYMQQHYQNAQENFKKSFGHSGAFSGANAGAGFGYNDNYGGHFPNYPNAFPGPAPGLGTKYNYAGSRASSSSSSSPGHSGAIDARVNKYPASSTGSGSGYNYNSQSGSHHHEGSNYGDDEMHYSTATTKDGIMETKMEGKKCDAHGCASSTSTSMQYKPNAGTGYAKSGGHGPYSGGSTSSSSSSSSHSRSHSDYASSKGGNDASHYDLAPPRQTTTTRRPYEYTTTPRPYTYSTKYPTTTKYSYTSSTTTKPYILSTNLPKSRQ